MFRLASGLVFALLINIGAAGAMAQDWQVVRVAGVVWVVKADMEPMRATAGMILPDNATLATMGQSRAMLRHGEDILNVGPSTRVAPQARKIHGLTTVLMPEGNLDLNIEKLGAPHFAVETPVLAAVVKGTQFSVAVSPGNGVVSVKVGRVQVKALAAGQAVDVTNGQTAKLSGGSLQVSGAGPHSVIQSVAPQTPMVGAAVAADDASGSAGVSASGSAGVSASGSAGVSASGKAASNAGGNSAAHASANSNAGGNSANSNAGGNSANSNAGGNGNGNGNAGGNSANSNAGGNGKGVGVGLGVGGVGVGVNVGSGGIGISIN